MHAAAHSTWGAVTGFLVLVIFLQVTSGSADPFASPIWVVSVALISATGLSTLAGWALAWRAAIRRAADDAALPLLAE